MEEQKDPANRDPATGRFGPGNNISPGGRAGKIGMKIKEDFALFLEKNLPKIQENFDKLPPEDQFKWLMAMTERFVPKMAITTHDLSADAVAAIASVTISIIEGRPVDIVPIQETNDYTWQEIPKGPTSE